LDHAAKVDGFYPLDLKQYYEAITYVYFTTNEATRLKDFMGVSHVNDPAQLLAWTARDSFLPLITASQKPVFADDQETLKSVLRETFDPRHTVYLPAEASNRLRATNQANARILSSKFSAHRVKIEAEAETPAMVVIAQAFYHPWHAYVDGKRSALWRAN